ncbi:MAG: acetyl-CoA carboxylase carboxyltransferase component [Gammaproteobacteria bacterium]|jgi:acetyl-CoA carboxylase carboxyltransferase component
MSAAKAPETTELPAVRGLKKLKQRQRDALAMGGPRRIARQHERGRMTVRERIDHLVDDGTFYEYAALAQSELPQMRDKTPADGKIAGLADIDGRPVVVHGDDATVLAGAGGRVAMAKIKRSYQYAVTKGYPIVNLGDSGGVRMPDNMGAANMMRMSNMNFGAPRNRAVPVIATLMGQCYGDPSWNAARADLVVMVKGAVMAVSGPKIIAGATGEQVSAEELGGWEMHARVTGQVDLFADDDAHCLELVRKALSFLPTNADELPPRVNSGDDPQRRLDDLPSLLPDSPRKAFDMRRVLKMVADDGEVLELKPRFDPSLVTALIRLDGYTVGVMANNSMGNAGAMGPGACEKATSFICLCDSFHIPLVTFHDTPGFFVSKAAEERKMPLKIMTFLDAWHQCSVPRIGVIARKSYGFAHRHMLGARMDTDYLVAWPNADVSFMAPEGAVEVVYGTSIGVSEDEKSERAARLAEINRVNEPWEPASLHLIDDVIDPRDTRSVVIRALARARGPSGDRGRSRRNLANWPTGF